MTTVKVSTLTVDVSTMTIDVSTLTVDVSMLARSDAPGPTVVEMSRASSAASTSWAGRQETSRGLSRFPLTVAHIS